MGALAAFGSPAARAAVRPEHPRIWLTPHVASATQAETAAEALLDNLRHYEAGLPLEGLVNRDRGY
jgi:glyoxylate/hydroxypyruvate reductase A